MKTKCEICNKEFSSMNGLAKHVVFSHKPVSKEQYFLRYLSTDEATSNPICYCGTKKKFRRMGEGYRQCCSPTCNRNRVEYRAAISKANSGRKQSVETIAKRVANTDYDKAMETRASNTLEKHGVSNTSKLAEVRSKISESNAGLSRPRSEDHQRKIVESKRANGTNKMSDEAIAKIKATVKALYDSDNPPVTIAENNIKNHKSGHFAGHFYRSSYELTFLEYCVDNNVKFESAENKTYRVKYIYEDTQKMYYPDYYLPEYDIIVEIKPESMLNVGSNPAKIKAATEHYGDRFIVFTETDLNDLVTSFSSLQLYKTVI